MELKDKHLNRRIKCRKCSQYCEVVDGSKCGGLPGIAYNECRSCGFLRAITFKVKKAKL